MSKKKRDKIKNLTEAEYEAYILSLAQSDRPKQS